MQIITCKGCGTENKEDNQFCSSCGDLLRKTAFLFGPLKPGMLLDGRYKIIDLIKTGGMGSVYKALFTKVDKICAVKELIPPYGTPEEQEKATEWFKREAKILSQLSHPNLPEFMDCFVTDGRYYLTMNFIEGEDLETKLKREGNPGFSVYEVVEWTRQVLEVLNYLHSQDPPVVYRDMKPANIMVNDEGVAKIIDFGIARVICQQGEIKKTAIGTDGYAPIEQCKGNAEPRSDLYALGATMHHLLTGVAPIPFRFKPLREVIPSIPQYLEDIVAKALQDKLEDRFSNAKEMLAAFPEKPVAEKGNKNWDFGTGGDITAPITLSEGRIFFSSGDKKVYSLDAREGRKVWEFNSGSYAFSSAPCIWEGSLYFGCGKKIYCLSAGTGEKRWEYNLPCGIESSPAAGEGRVFFGANDGIFYCLDAKEGKPLCEFKSENSIVSRPVLADKFVYFGSDDYSIYCLFADSGKQIWKFKTGGMIKASPCIANKYIYCGSFDNRLYCLDSENGRKAWEFKTKFWVYSTPCVVEDRVYFGSFDKTFYCIDGIKFGKKIWDFKTPGRITSSPCYAAGRVYFGSSNNTFYCLGAKNGRNFWSFKTDGKIWSGPCLDEGRIYFGSNDGKLYCLDTGKK